MVIDFRKAHHTLRDRAESLFRPAIIRVYLLPQHSGDELEVVADTMLGRVLADSSELEFGINRVHV